MTATTRHWGGEMSSSLVEEYPYIYKRVYHKPIQLATHLQAVAVQVTLGSTPVNILSVYTPSRKRLTTQDLSHLIRGLNGHILITGDFNGHNYSWGSLSNDIRGDVLEGFTDKNNLCILNDGSPTYLKPQAQHSQKPTSAIDLSICTPDRTLRCTWEVLSDTHGSDHYPVLISVSLTSADTDQVGDSNHWVFPKADWEQFAESCMDKITGHILQDQDPLTSFVELVISAAKDSIPRATTVPKKSNTWFDEECREMLRARRALDRKVHRGGGPRAETLMSFRRTQAQARRLFTLKAKHQHPNQACVRQGEENIWQKCLPTQAVSKREGWCFHGWPLPMSMQQHSQITSLPTTAQDSRQSRNRMRRSESTSLLTISKSTTNPSGWGISGVPSWKPNPVPLDLMESTTIYWNISLRTHWKSSKIS